MIEVLSYLPSNQYANTAVTVLTYNQYNLHNIIYFTIGILVPNQNK